VVDPSAAPKPQLPAPRKYLILRVQLRGRALPKNTRFWAAYVERRSADRAFSVCGLFGPPVKSHGSRNGVRATRLATRHILEPFQHPDIAVGDFTPYGKVATVR
jgi:hypothetical protein